MRIVSKEGKITKRRYRWFLPLLLILLFIDYLVAPFIVVGMYIGKIYSSPFTKESVKILSRLLNTSDKRLVYSAEVRDTEDEYIMVFDPITLKSATGWILQNDKGSINKKAESLSPNFNLYLSGQFKPKNIGEYMIARNFYGNASILKDKSGILAIEGNVLAGNIVLTNPSFSQVLCPYIFTIPIPVLSVHFDQIPTEGG